MALSLSDYVITEAGFASELGAEKFFDIKARYGGLSPGLGVIVATVRALRYHGGVNKREVANPNPEAVFRGLSNLDKHIENIRCFNVNPVVTINRFLTDTPEEIATIISHCESQE